MPKAEHDITTHRRSFLRLAAATPALSLPAFLGVQAVPAEARAATPVPGADAELIRLGLLLDEAAAREAAAWAAYARAGHDDENEKIAEALNAHTGAVVHQIEQLTSASVAGLLVKLRAIEWCCAGEPITAENLCDSRDPTTDMRLLASVVSDLAAMGRAAA